MKSIQSPLGGFSLTARKYEGEWIMLPELSFYQVGEAPESGRYHIEILGDDVRFSIDWVTNGVNQSVSFEGPLDGQLHRINTVPDGFTSFTHIDANTLESTLVVKEMEMAYARRQVSNDGKLLAILQVNKQSDGSSVRISQVYRRSS